MKTFTLMMARQIGRAACMCEERRTGRRPQAMNVVFCGEAIIVTLHGVLSTEEIQLSESRVGNVDLHEFHRQSLLANAEPLILEIEKILDIRVRHSHAEMDSSTNTLVQVFTAGPAAEIFLFDERVLSEIENSLAI